ncbi:TonB-dependent receptor plug domain-containing protein [Flavobacterium sp. LB1P71]|uniref:TonB-dependent receptor n=1 Tax=unclassified Flavobacterium TaxID=196869 RepID=UPI003AB09E63
MFESFNRNKKCHILCFLGMLLTSVFLNAQVQKVIPDIEKIYLHTDRSSYFLGDDLWYKAYSVRAYNNLLFDNSNVLYVELISPDSKIIAQNKTNLEMGLGYGDFKLTDSISVKPGVYQIRAYTNWNRNFGDDFVFKKNIEIIDVFEAHFKPNKAQNTAIAVITTENESSNKNKITVDFCPEGGSLLENVASIVGFKAVDSDGNPINILGEIYDSDNELITTFLSPHDGMGKFQMIPTGGKNYYAKIKTLTGAEQRQELPKVTKEGYLLSFRTFKGKNIISINTNEATLAQNPNAALTVVCKAKGISYLESILTVTQTALSFELTKDKAPEGISQITLYDSNSKPQSERLVYIEKEPDFEVQLVADKASYKPNEKATINISSKSKTGVAKSASFSLSVTDMNGIVEDKDFGTTISSYFLMESDIRGKVYNPSYYFNPTNLKRLEHLDDLLLTQGWRDFLWKTMPKFNDAISYKAEKGITISGRVKQLLGEKALVNNNMTLSLINKKHMNIFNTTTDSIGSFKFENIMFSGKTNMFLNSRNKKGKFRGEIIVNPIEQSPLLVAFENEPIKWTETTRRIVENVFKKFVAFGIKPENILDEVSIVAKRKNQTPIFYGIPDNSYVPDESVATFTDIYDLIVQKVPGVISSDDSVRFMRFDGAPLFLLNGNTAFKAEIDFVQLGDIEKIDVIKGAQATMFYGADAANGIIAVYTKPDAKTSYEKGGFHSIKKEIEGFYTARIFYAPNPEQAKTEIDNKADVRNTLYWNPYVHPDKTGNASVNYYNTKVETKVKVALEGITSGGIPVVKNTYYTIKK